MLFGWLKALPDDAVRRSPMLSVFYGHMLMVSGDLADWRPDSTTRNARWPPYPARADSPVGRYRGAPDAPRDHRHLPGLARASPRRCGGHGGTRRGAHSTWPALTTISPGAARPGSSGSPHGRTAT